MTTFVALGDSITLGIGDPMPDGSWRGWAALLAGTVPGVRFHNLATSGAQTSDVLRLQLDRALALEPALAAVVVGVNDTLRATFDPDRVSCAFEHVVSSLRASGAVVLTMGLPDPGRMLGLPRALAAPLTRRIAAVNQVTEQVATRYATLHFNAANHPETYDRRMWSVDRLHPGERGHRLLARAYHDLLNNAGFPVGEPPDSEPSRPAPTRRAQFGWLATKGTRWVLSRATDLVPFLLASAAKQWWHGRLEATRDSHLAVAHLDQAVQAVRGESGGHHRQQECAERLMGEGTQGRVQTA